MNRVEFFDDMAYTFCEDMKTELGYMANNEEYFGNGIVTKEDMEKIISAIDRHLDFLMFDIARIGESEC